MQSKRVLYFDVLNVFSCFSVITLHCNGYVKSFDQSDSLWWLHVLIEVLFYNAVPLFFMLSGATLVGYRNRYDTKTFIKKRVKKTFVPYIFMSVFFNLLYAVNSYMQSGELSILGSIKLLILCIVTGRSPYSSFWFFIPLFLLYIFMPFLSVMMEHLTNKQQRWLILLIFIFQSCLYPIATLSPTCTMEITAIHEFPISNYVIYILLGYYISHNPIEKNMKMVKALIFLSCILMLGRYVLFYNTNAQTVIADDYIAAYAVVPSATIFILAKRYFSNIEEGRIIRFLSKRSFGIYLIQQFFINLMFQFIPGKSIILLLMTPVIYLLCAFIVCLVQQSKYTRWIMP